MNQYCFVDTSFFKAFADSKDDFHTRALQIFRKSKETKLHLVTSNYILDETFTVIRSKCGLAVVKQFKTILEEFEEDLKIVRVLIGDEVNAWHFFLNDWSNLSFTDCVSFVQMKRLEIKTVLAFDDHFRRAGFEII